MDSRMEGVASELPEGCREEYSYEIYLGMAFGCPRGSNRRVVYL
jgi:hypothetical protein